MDRIQASSGGDITVTDDGQEYISNGGSIYGVYSLTDESSISGIHVSFF